MRIYVSLDGRTGHAHRTLDCETALLGSIIEFSIVLIGNNNYVHKKLSSIKH